MAFFKRLWKRVVRGKGRVNHYDSPTETYQEDTPTEGVAGSLITIHGVSGPGVDTKVLLDKVRTLLSGESKGQGPLHALAVDIKPLATAHDIRVCSWAVNANAPVYPENALTTRGASSAPNLCVGASSSSSNVSSSPSVVESNHDTSESQLAALEEERGIMESREGWRAGLESPDLTTSSILCKEPEDLHSDSPLNVQIQHADKSTQTE